LRSTSLAAQVRLFAAKQPLLYEMVDARPAEPSTIWLLLLLLVQFLATIAAATALIFERSFQWTGLR